MESPTNTMVLTESEIRGPRLDSETQRSKFCSSFVSLCHSQYVRFHPWACGRPSSQKNVFAALKTRRKDEEAKVSSWYTFLRKKLFLKNLCRDGPLIPLTSLGSQCQPQTLYLQLVRTASRWPWLAKSTHAWLPEDGLVASHMDLGLWWLAKRREGCRLPHLVLYKLWVWSEGAHQHDFPECFILPWFVSGHNDMNQSSLEKESW